MNESLPLAEYILRVLSFRPFLQNPPQSPKSGVELVAYWAYWENIGVINSRPDIADSQKHSRLLRDQNVKHYPVIPGIPGLSMEQP